MADQENPDLAFKEVDDEVRRERMHALWKAYGKYLISMVVGVVLVVAGREGWSEYKRTTEEGHAAVFAEAVTAAALVEDPTSIWTDAEADTGPSYGALGQLRLAASLLDASKTDEALAVYKALSTDSTADIRFRELATLNSAIIISDKKNDAATARSLLSSISQKGKIWYHSATEQLAILDIVEGNLDAALNKISQLENDPQTPQAIRSRSTQFRSVIESAQKAAPTIEASESTDEVSEDAQKEEDK